VRERRCWMREDGTVVVFRDGAVAGCGMGCGAMEEEGGAVRGGGEKMEELVL